MLAKMLLLSIHSKGCQRLRNPELESRTQRRAASRPGSDAAHEESSGPRGAIAGAGGCYGAAAATSRPIGKISAKFSSFSAVSAPIFAIKYAFCSIFQNLPDYQAENFEIRQNFAKFATFAKILLNFHKNC